MPEIEFLENDPPNAPRPVAQPQIVLDRGFLVRLIPAVFALVGAVLVTRAPFSWIYADVERSDAITFTSTDPGGSHKGAQLRIGYDGWGRLHSDGLEGFVPGHGLRYGIVLVVCAAVLVGSAVVFAVAAATRDAPYSGRLTRIAESLLVAAAAGAAAMSASFYLRYDAVRSQFQDPVSTNPVGAQVSVQLGRAWLIAAMAALAAMLGVVSSLVIARLGSNRHDLPGGSSQPPQNLPVYVSQIDPVGETL